LDPFRLSTPASIGGCLQAARLCKVHPATCCRPRHNWCNSLKVSSDDTMQQSIGNSLLDTTVEGEAHASLLGSVGVAYPYHQAISNEIQDNPATAHTALSRCLGGRVWLGKANSYFLHELAGVTDASRCKTKIWRRCYACNWAEMSWG
jgi:hypothetical protein